MSDDSWPDLLPAGRRALEPRSGLFSRAHELLASQLFSPDRPFTGAASGVE